MDVYQHSSFPHPQQHEQLFHHQDTPAALVNMTPSSSHTRSPSLSYAFSPSCFPHIDEGNELGLVHSMRTRTSSMRDQIDPSLRDDVEESNNNSPYPGDDYASYQQQRTEQPSQAPSQAPSPFSFQVHLQEDDPAEQQSVSPPPASKPKSRAVSTASSHKSLSSSTSSSTSSRWSLRDPAHLDPSCFPSSAEFDAMTEVYMSNLAPKKRGKALIDQEMYDKVLTVLMDPTVTTTTTAQFRFWAKKMFKLVEFNGEFVATHEGRPVAVKEQIYDVLVYCHGQSGHGGRDKTMLMVRNFYSWVPKELVAQFVKGCPICDVKREANPNFFGSHNCPPLTGKRRKSSIVPLPSVDNEDEDPSDPAYVSPSASTASTDRPSGSRPRSSKPKKPEPKTVSLEAAKAAAAAGAHTVEATDSPTKSRELHAASLLAAAALVAASTAASTSSSASTSKKGLLAKKEKVKKPRKPAKSRKAAPTEKPEKMPSRGRPQRGTKSWAVQMAVEGEDEEGQGYEEFDDEEGGMQHHWGPRYHHAGGPASGYLDCHINGGGEYYEHPSPDGYSTGPYCAPHVYAHHPGPPFNYQHPSHDLQRESSRSTIDSPLIQTPHLDPYSIAYQPHPRHPSHLYHVGDPYAHRLSVSDLYPSHLYSASSRAGYPPSCPRPSAYDHQRAAAARRASTGQLLGYGGGPEGAADFHRRSSQGRARTRQEQRMMEENEARSRRSPNPIHEELDVEDEGEEFGGDDGGYLHARYGQIIEGGRGSIGGDHIAPGNSLMLEPSSYAYEGGHLSPSQPHFDLSPHSAYPPHHPAPHHSPQYYQHPAYSPAGYQQPPLHHGSYFPHQHQHQPYLAPTHSEYNYSPHGSAVPLPQHPSFPANNVNRFGGRPVRPAPIRRSSSQLQHQLDISDLTPTSSSQANGCTVDGPSPHSSSTVANSPSASASAEAAVTIGQSLLSLSQSRRSPAAGGRPQSSGTHTPSLIRPSLLMCRGSSFADVASSSSSSSSSTGTALPLDRRKSYVGVSGPELFAGLVPKVQEMMAAIEAGAGSVEGEGGQVGFQVQAGFGEGEMMGDQQQQQHHQQQEESVDMEQ